MDKITLVQLDYNLQNLFTEKYKTNLPLLFSILCAQHSN